MYNDDYNQEYGIFKKIGIFFSALGIGSGLIAGAVTSRNEKKAEEIYNVALSAYNDEKKIYDEKVTTTRIIIVDVVKKKKVIMGKQMKKFLKYYGRLSPNIEFSDPLGIDEIKKFKLSIYDDNKVNEIQKESKNYLSYNYNNLGKNAGDVALLMVQDGTVENMVNGIQDLVVISKTEDAEERNALLDEYKIKNISVIADVSVATIGYGLSEISKAFASGKTLDNAKVLAENLNAEKTIIRTKITEVSGIECLANTHLKVLNDLEPLIKEFVLASAKIIKRHDNLFHRGRIPQNKFSDEELEILSFTFSLMNAAKSVIDSPIISKTGLVYEKDRLMIDKIKDKVYELKMLAEKLAQKI